MGRIDNMSEASGGDCTGQLLNWNKGNPMTRITIRRRHGVHPAILFHPVILSKLFAPAGLPIGCRLIGQV